MTKFQKELLLNILDIMYEQSASESCDDTEFENSQDMHDFLVEMYKFQEPEEDSSPYVYEGKLVAGMSEVISYLMELIKNTL